MQGCFFDHFFAYKKGLRINGYFPLMQSPDIHHSLNYLNDLKKFMMPVASA